MRTMKAIFSFFKAGQGSFYGGRIWDHETIKVFTVVYDCGTSHFIAGKSQSLNNEITDFKYRPCCFPCNNDEIELLFISHLDYDHVSGLKRLLTEFEVKNIILPYIGEEHRKFFLTSMPADNSPDNNNLSFADYSSFIDSPHTFIQNNSKNSGIKVFFVKSDSEPAKEYQGFDKENQSEDMYPNGTPDEKTEEKEFNKQEKVKVYENNLQFFIKQYWEFTTYSKSVSQNAIDKLHDRLKKILKKKAHEYLTPEDIRKIVTDNRKEAHKCYTDCIGEINSHGLVLLHGPIGFKCLYSRIYSDCELNHLCNDYCCRHFSHGCHNFINKNQKMLGTLLFGDTSINPGNNPLSFPKAFKDKLVNAHIVQVPHHGSSKNWDFNEFQELKIGNSFNRRENRVAAVCNFGYGNKYGHPSHEVLNDLRSTIFLNTQFSRINIEYDVIY